MHSKGGIWESATMATVEVCLLISRCGVSSQNDTPYTITSGQQVRPRSFFPHLTTFRFATYTVQNSRGKLTNSRCKVFEAKSGHEVSGTHLSCTSLSSVSPRAFFTTDTHFMLYAVVQGDCGEKCQESVKKVMLDAEFSRTLLVGNFIIRHVPMASD